MALGYYRRGYCSSVRQQVARALSAAGRCLPVNPAKAAADDGLFPPIFARVNKAGTVAAAYRRRTADYYLPVQQYVAERRERVWSGLLRVGYSPCVFYLTLCAALVAIGPLSLFSKVPGLYLLTTFVAFVVASGRSSVPARSDVLPVTLMVITALYMRVELQPHSQNPYPLAAPVNRLTTCS